MTKLVQGAGLILVGGILVLGFGKVSSYLKGGRALINDKLDKSTPMEFEAARVQELIAAKERELSQYDDKLAEIEYQRAQTGRRISEVQKKLDDEKKVLAHIGKLLEDKRDVYTINGHDYSSTQVNSDAKARVERAKQLGNSLADYGRMLKEQEQAINVARQNLGNARNKVASLKTEFQQLQMRNTNADLRLEMARMVGDLGQTPEVAGELLKAKENYERRVASAERAADRSLAGPSSNGGIDYSAVVESGDAKAEIDAFLKGTPAASTTRPSADVVVVPAVSN